MVGSVNLHPSRSLTPPAPEHHHEPPIPILGLAALLSLAVSALSLIPRPVEVELIPALPLVELIPSSCWP